ncbi:MAG: UDP-glucose 6-dehydrogenase [Thermoprotei archaeon]|nr:MAG: UDP-glucose 6-dehydrogenase [Thermoprotei archaeon]
MIGLGYVGLTMAVFLASKGVRVIGVDVDKEKIEKLSRGIPTFYEEKLEYLLNEGIRENTLEFTDSYEYAISNTSITFVTVGTPLREDGSIDLSYIEEASTSIGKALKKKNSYHLVVIRSTVIPGTCLYSVKNIIEEFSRKKAGIEWGLCMNPEFLKEGSALRDLSKPARIIIGEYDKKSGDILEEFYRQIYSDVEIPILRTSLSTAEMIKYANNAFLATKISFINSIADICEKIEGCDVVEVAKAIGLDFRISPLFLRAGLGYGGSCFSKDIKALIEFAKEVEACPILFESVDQVNQRQPLKAVKFCEQLIGNVKGRRIAVLGLAFKPGTDDIREAPSLKIINELLKRGANVVVYDPVAMEKVKRLYGEELVYASNVLECIAGAECALIITEWNEFKKITPQIFKEYMRTPAIVDGRRIFNPEDFMKAGVKYMAIGLGFNYSTR